MRNRSWVFALAIAALSVAPRTVDAHHLDSTSWVLSGTDRIIVVGVRPVRTTIPSATLTVDATSHFVATGAPIDYSGTYVDKRRPKRGFKATVDPASVATIQARLVEAVMEATQATSMNVKRIRVGISGSVSKEGQTIKVTTKIVMTGSAIIEGRRRAGTATERGAFTGHRGM